MSDKPLSLTGKIRNAIINLSHLPRALKLVWVAGKSWTVSQIILLVVQGLLPVALVYLTKILIDKLVFAINSGGAWNNVQPVIWLGGLMGAIMVLSQILGSISQMIRTAHAEKLQDHIFELIHEKAIVADLAFYEQPDFFDHLHRARYEATYRPIELMNQIGSLLQNGITLVAMGAVLLPYGLWLPVVLILSTLPALYVVLRFTVRQHHWRRKRTHEERLTRYYDNLLTNSHAAAELRLFGLGNYFKNKFEGLRKQLRKEKLKLALDQRVAEFSASVIALLLTVATLAWMAWRVIQGFGTLGDLALFYQAFNQGQSLMRSLLQNVGQLYSNSLFLGDLFEYLNLEPKIVNKSQPTPAPKKLERGIDFENVTFNYQDSERFALKNFSLKIEANKIVAIVGANGAGKSTLLKLICRFYDPEEGKIKLDDVDLRDYPIDELRQLITVLFQTPVYYNTTVKENIALGNINQNLTQEEIEIAARDAGADATIQRLPKTYDNLLGKKFGGTELSVGEWQRIALARAFLRDSPLILLDEPTSAMDPWAETDWLERLLKRAKNHTVVIITHRFTTAMFADVIHVMEAGRIIESGSHEELLALKGRYADSWSAQMREKAEEPKAHAAND